MIKSTIVKLINYIDAIIKFPNLKSGEIGIQVGFDLSSKNLTSDVLKMAYRTQKNGLVIAVDPDPNNHRLLQPIIDKNKLNIKPILKATYSKKTTEKLVMGMKASYNKLDVIKATTSPHYSNNTIEVALDTLDNIIDSLNVDYKKIGHINITNNGAEFPTLLGMTKILDNCENINITIISGRPNKMGEINGKKDHEVVIEFLTQKGFSCQLLRMNKSFWWGVVNNLIFKQRWIFGQTRFGVIMAWKGDKKTKFYQSFS